MSPSLSTCGDRRIELDLFAHMSTGHLCHVDAARAADRGVFPIAGARTRRPLVRVKVAGTLSTVQRLQGAGAVT